MIRCGSSERYRGPPPYLVVGHPHFTACRALISDSGCFLVGIAVLHEGYHLVAILGGTLLQMKANAPPSPGFSRITVTPRIRQPWIRIEAQGRGEGGAVQKQVPRSLSPQSGTTATPVGCRQVVESGIALRGLINHRPDNGNSSKTAVSGPVLPFECNSSVRTETGLMEQI